MTIDVTILSLQDVIAVMESLPPVEADALAREWYAWDLAQCQLHKPLTRAQRRVADAIQRGAIVRRVESEEDDPHGFYLLMHLDPTDPIGISYTEHIQQRTLRPLVLRGLLNDCWETPYVE